MSEKFNEMDAQLAMLDLEPYFNGNKALRITTQMSLKGLPIKEQNQWVKEKLLISGNKEFWENFFK